MDQNTDSQGQGWFGDSEGHAKAGKLGGEATAESHDRSFYEEIGSEGGKASPTKFQKGDSRASEAGRKGGEASSNRSDND